MKQRIELMAKKMEIRLSEKELFWIEVGIKWICVLMVFVLYSVGLWTISENRAEKRAAAEYKIQLQNYISERDAEDARIRSCLLLGVRPRRLINSRSKYAISVPDVPRFKCNSSITR